MANYEHMNISEVHRLAKQGDKDALYEMAWRMPSDVQKNPVESCAWQDYWFEKAADAGNIDAKSRYARSLVNRIMNAEDRQKAMCYFESLVNDFDAGRLVGEQKEDGALAKLWLGIMLCQGYHTRRDAIMGAELIQAAGTYFNGFQGFGYRLMREIGEIYASGLAQIGEEPSVSDLEKAIQYLDIAIMRFNPEKDDPNNRGFLNMTIDMLETQKKRVVNKKQVGDTNTTFSAANERREKMMGISDTAHQRLEADKVALARLRQRLSREGW